MKKIIYPKLNEALFNKAFNETLAKFYSNWYFYQNYKNKPHYEDAFKIIFKDTTNNNEKTRNND